MLSKESLEEYRRMSLGDKMALTLQMIRENTPFLLEGPADVVQRRFELLRRENDLRNQSMLQAIARTRKKNMTDLDRALREVVAELDRMSVP